MDTSDIKMCEKGEEIQKYSPVADADVSLDEGICLDTKGDVYWRCRGQGFIWLPRQDQLQAMVIDNTPNPDKLGSLLSRFWVFCSCFYQGKLTFEVFTSMEQLWLAFVMKEKYNKTWDGTDWIIKQNGQIV